MRTLEGALLRPSPEQLNAASLPAFMDALAPFFEGAPRFLARLAGARPFHGEADLFASAVQVALAMPEEEQVELVDAHPRIGAPAASVSAASFAEQGYATPAGTEAAALDRLNADYEARFGFRFVVFVAGRSRSEIVPLLQARLARERPDELQTALRDVVAIARDRWRKAGVTAS